MQLLLASVPRTLLSSVGTSSNTPAKGLPTCYIPTMTRTAATVPANGNVRGNTQRDLIRSLSRLEAKVCILCISKSCLMQMILITVIIRAAILLALPCTRWPVHSRPFTSRQVYGSQTSSSSLTASTPFWPFNNNYTTCAGGRGFG